MLIEQTLEKLTAMKLGAMAAAVQQQLGSDEATALSFEDRLGVLVDTEWTAREQRKLTRRLRAAKLRYAASLEAVDFTHPRRLKRQQVVSLGSGAWIADRHNLLIIGPTGIGKSFLASAFVERACRQGFSARYVRMPRLLHEVAVGRGRWLLHALADPVGQTRPPGHRRLVTRAVAGRGAARPGRGHRRSRGARGDAHRQSTPGPRLACGHRGFRIKPTRFVTGSCTTPTGSS